MISFILLLFQIIKGGNIKMAKKTKVVKASLAAALVTSAIVPVASAQTSATTTEVSSVIIEQNGQLIKIPMTVYSDLLGAGKIPTVKHIVLNNAETFTIDQFSEALGAYNDLNQTLGHLAEKSEPVTPSGVVDGKVENGEIVPGETPSTPEVTLDDVTAVNATGVFMVGKTATLPGTVDVVLTYSDGTIKIESGVKVTWNDKISTEEADFGSVDGTVTIDGEKHTVSYEYTVVETKEEFALAELENAVNNGQYVVDTAVEVLEAAVTAATEAADNLTEDSTTEEVAAAQTLVNVAKEAQAKVENAITTAQKAIADATAKAKTAGVSAEDIESAGKLDSSYAIEAIETAKADIKAAQDIINGSDQTPTPGEVAIESVSAINKTKVVVNFTVAVDEVSKENFTIAGGTVDGVELSEDKKSATLSVSDLEYATKYTVAVKDVKVEGKVVDFGSKEFTTPAVTDDFKLEVTPAATIVSANGADNTVIKFALLDSNGEVDKTADNMVLEIGTTFGQLANNRVTVQDGVGQVVLQSEFSTKEITAKVTAQIIEASTDHKELIGKVAGEALVNFVPAGVTTDPNAVTFQDAESNQADRVVLYFDKAVSPATFVQTNSDGTFKTTADKKRQLLKKDVVINIKQNNEDKTVVGIVPVKGNDKAVEVLIDVDTKNPKTYLTDNAKVDLDVRIGTTQNQRSFILTDARQPEFTGVTVDNLRTLSLKFSESYSEGSFSIDGLLTGTLNDPADLKQFTIVPGKFDPVKGIDNRDTATVKLGTVIKDGKEVQNYFTAGQHSITVNKLKDWAGQTDNANVSTSQTLNFTVTADETTPTATVKVESPEQFRVTFNKDIDANSADLNALFNKAFKVYDENTKSWKNIQDHSAFKDNNSENPNVLLENLLKATKVNDSKTKTGNEYVVELTSDWSRIMAKENDVYYNYKFQFDFEKELFTSLSNGKENQAFKLDLNESGSALNAADNNSPVILDVFETDDDSIYEIVMSEPVKLNTSQGDDAGETVALKQNKLPIVQAEFQGKDEKGKSVVIKANVKGYSDTNAADMKFEIQTAVSEQLQALVNKGYSENWTVVVRSISDDIGNTASTVTRDFVVKSEVTETTNFQIWSTENSGFPDNRVIAYDAENTGRDRLEITFTKGVSQAGVDNLTSTANWTLNGNRLSTLANVESIKVEDVNGIEKDGYEKVVITFSDDRAFGKHSNVISVNRNIKSLDGTPLTGEYEVLATTLNQTSFSTGTPVGLNNATDLEVLPDPATGKTLVAFKQLALTGDFKNAPADILQLTILKADGTFGYYDFEARTRANGEVVYLAIVPTVDYTGSSRVVVNCK